MRMKDMNAERIFTEVAVLLDDVNDAVVTRKGRVMTLTQGDRTGKLVKRQIKVTITDDEFET